MNSYGKIFSFDEWRVKLCVHAVNRKKFHNVCLRRKLKVNVGESKMMAFHSKEVEGCDFNALYRVSVPIVGRCGIVLGAKKYEENERV